MRCRVGDLAVAVRSVNAPEHVGKVVRCVSAIGDSWEIEPKLPNAAGRVPYWAARDECLRPLRDNPGEDEMLRIARLNDQDKANALRHAMQKHRERLVEEAPKQ